MIPRDDSVWCGYCGSPAGEPCVAYGGDRRAHDWRRETMKIRRRRAAADLPDFEAPPPLLQEALDPCQ